MRMFMSTIWLIFAISLLTIDIVYKETALQLQFWSCLILSAIWKDKE